jgi:hypothetical protein
MLNSPYNEVPLLILFDHFLVARAETRKIWRKLNQQQFSSDIS